jgi:hypothetical protein
MTYKEIVDSKTNITSTDKSDPGFPTIKEMRKSQADGNEGIGLNDQSYNDDCKDFNQGVDTTGNYDAFSTSDGDGDETPSLPWTKN